MGIVEEIFDVMERIDKEISGEVYKIRDKQSKKIMALKVMDKAKSTQLAEDFHKKWETVKLLSHPNLPSYLDFYQDSLCYYIIMEYSQLRKRQ
jgi:serine/threonine protein kinase